MIERKDIEVKVDDVVHKGRYEANLTDDWLTVFYRDDSEGTQLGGSREDPMRGILARQILRELVARSKR